MRRRTENPIAKQRLLEEAETLMLQKGFTATSIDEICQKAKLTKGTFFHYFANKEELGMAVLARFCDSKRDKMLTGCSCHKDKDPLERIDHYLDYVGKMIKKEGGKGCLLGIFSTELSELSPLIRLACDKAFKEWAATFKKDLKEVKQKYAPRRDINIDSLAEHFIAVVEGSQVLAKARQDKNLLTRNLEHFKEYLHCVFKN